MGFFGGSRAVLNEMTAAWETARTKRGIGEQRAQMYIGSGGLLRAQYGSHPPITIANLAQPASTAAAVPTGAVFQWVLPVAPVGFLLCDGRVVSTTEYPELFALIGTMFGEGGGGGFRLPNMGGRVPVGAGTPSFPDSFSGSLYVGATGGSPAMEISGINMPEHSHGIGEFEHSHTLSSHDHSVTGLVVEAHTHLIDFTTSTAYDVTGEVATDLSHDHSLDLDLSITTDGPREYTDEDETSNSQPFDLAHTHTPAVSTNDADDTVTVGSGGAHGHGVSSSGTAASAGAHYHDIASSGGNATITDDGAHLHSVAINTDTDGAHGHTAIFDAESETEVDTGHGHGVSSSGTAASAGAHEHDITTTIDDSGDYIVMTDDGTHLHSVAINTDTDGAHGHTAIFDAESETESGGTHTHTVSTALAGAHDHSVDTTTDDSGFYIVMTDDGVHGHSVDINTDTDGAHGHTFTGANSGVTGLAGGHSHTLDLDDVGIAFDYDNVSQGRHWDTDITISDDLSVVGSALPSTAGVSGLTTDDNLATAAQDIISDNPRTHTTGAADIPLYDSHLDGWYEFQMVGGLGWYDQTYTGGSYWSSHYAVTDSGDGIDYRENSNDHTHDVTIPSASLTGSVTIDHANSSLGGTDHSHTLNGDIDVATDAGTGAVTGLNAGLVVDSPATGTVDGIATDGVTDHYHSIAGEIDNTDGGHAHDVDGDTGLDEEGHTHALSGSTETGGEHSHAGTAVATWTGGGTSAHSHSIDADSIGATISNTDGGHAHDVDGNTGLDTAGHTHTLSGATETDGAHEHSVNTTGTAAPAGVHTHSIDADSIGATIDNDDGAHAHDVDGNTGLDTAGHTHTLSGATETDGAHEHSVDTTGTAAPVGNHDHSFDLSDEVVVTISDTQLDHHHSLSSASAGGTSGSTSLDHYHVLGDGSTGTQEDAVLVGGSLGDSGTLTTDDVIISAGTRTEMEGRAYPERMEVMQPYLVMAFIIKAA